MAVGTIDFSIALRMRDLPGLQERVARGETISAGEMERTFLPLASQYDALKKWLQGEGFIIVTEDPDRLSIFVRGTLAQIEKSLQTKIVGVTVNGVAPFRRQDRAQPARESRRAGARHQRPAALPPSAQARRRPPGGSHPGASPTRSTTS